MTNPVRRAATIAGGVSALARHLNIARSSVYEWIEKGSVPAARAVPIERLVGGQIPRHELCPAVFPNEESPRA